MGVKYDLLKGALTGVAQGASSAYVDQQRRGISQKQAPYQRMLWDNMVSDRKAKLLMDQQRMAAETARTQAYEADLGVRQEKLKAEQEKGERKKRADAKFAGVFGPMLRGSTDPSNPTPGLADMDLPTTERALQAVYTDPDLAGDERTTWFVELLESRRKGLREIEREKMRAEAAAKSAEEDRKFREQEAEKNRQHRTSEGNKNRTIRIGGGGGGKPLGDVQAELRAAEDELLAAKQDFDAASATADNAGYTPPGQAAQLAAAKTRLVSARNRYAAVKQKTAGAGKLRPPTPVPAPGAGEGLGIILPQ